MPFLLNTVDSQTPNMSIRKRVYTLDGILSILEMNGILRKHLVCHDYMGCWVLHGKGCLVDCFMGFAALLLPSGEVLGVLQRLLVYTGRGDMLGHLSPVCGLPLG